MRHFIKLAIALVWSAERIADSLNTYLQHKRVQLQLKLIHNSDKPPYDWTSWVPSKKEA
jgi:hypothetical protein